MAIKFSEIFGIKSQQEKSLQDLQIAHATAKQSIQSLQAKLAAADQSIQDGRMWRAAINDELRKITGKLLQIGNADEWSWTAVAILWCIWEPNTQ